MIRNPIPEFTFTPSFSSINTHQLRILSIEGLTGLKNIKEAFEDPLNNSEVELLISFLDRKYDFSLYEDAYDFIINIAKFSYTSLEFINANYSEFYDNMTISEAVEVVLTKLITNKGIPLTNGFPSEFNFLPGQENSTQIYNGQKWFPYIKGRSRVNYDQLLSRIMNNIQIGPDDVIYFHGSSWEGAISIMDQIEIIPRQNCTDFGFKNFYLTDTFQTAYLWSLRNTQSAVVIFIIKNEYIENLDNHLALNNEEIWKKTVYKIRNKPRSGNDLRNRKKHYKKFIEEIDSNDLISGPICANLSVENECDIRSIKYGDYIPYQYSFKESTIDDLNSMIAITLFFEGR
uniref:Uncharacterized protein n=1 Tax=viral metagenome TaxID=1070528 RepID=A0A6C0AED9_9ZZZZ